MQYNYTWLWIVVLQIHTPKSGQFQFLELIAFGYTPQPKHQDIIEQ